LPGIRFRSGESSGEEGKKWQQNPAQRGLEIHDNWHGSNSAVSELFATRRNPPVRYFAYLIEQP
jgi:hypothetical protein